MKKYLLSVIISTLSAGFLLIKFLGIAQAAAFSSLAIGPDIGTPGIGVQISTPLWPNYLNLNAGYSGFAFSYHTTVHGQGYHANFRLGGAPIYLSAYPFGPDFHLDAGIFINQNRIDLSAVPNNANAYVFNGHGYTKETLGMVTGQTHWNQVAPYLGIGWGNPFFGSRWTFTANAGVILEGGARARLSAANENAIPGAAENIAVSQAQFNHDLSFLTAFPVVNLGLEYRF